MAKVFVAFFNGIQNGNKKYAMPIFYESFIKGLQKNGNEVFVVMHSNWQGNFGKMPPKLLNRIKQFDPNVIFLFNNSFYDLSKEFDCPIVIYEVDSPLYYRNIEVIKKNPSIFKFFVAASSSIDILTEEFNVPKENIIQVPFFTEVKAINTENLYNICFIGSKFLWSNKNCYNKFMELKPTLDERKEFLRLISKCEENPFIQNKELFQNIESNKILSTFNQTDIVYLLSDYRRMEILSNIADLGLEIWGTPNWASDTYNNHQLILRYNHEPVYSLEDNQFIYNSSKIGINIGHLQAKKGFPWRVFDIMASNACLVTEYHGDFDKYLPQDLSLPYFSNAWEAHEICKKLLADENYRIDIVKRSQEIVAKKFRFKNVLHIMEDYLNLTMHSDIPGTRVAVGGIQRDVPGCYIIELNEWLEIKHANTKRPQKLKDKIRYKIWSHYNKILKRKGLI